MLFEEVGTMVYWVSFVVLVTLLQMWCGDLALSILLALFLFIFFLWPVVFLLDLLVEFVKALSRK